MAYKDFDIVGPDYGKLLLDEGKAEGKLLLVDITKAAKPHIAKFMHYGVDCLLDFIQDKIDTL